MKKILTSLPAKLLLGIIVGIVIGLYAPASVMTVLVPIKNIMGQIISFIVPLIVIGFIAPSITKLGNNATKLLGVALIIAYVSSVLAALLSMSAGYALIPIMNTASEAPALREVPADIFALSIPPIMSVMSALALSVMLGLAAVWTKAKTITTILDEFHGGTRQIGARRQHVAEVGMDDGIPDRDAVQDHVIDGPLDLPFFDAKAGSGVGLGVEVAKQGFEAQLMEGSG